jgi:hypothetical protein
VSPSSIKEIDTRRIDVANLPGRENRFPGERDFKKGPARSATNDPRERLRQWGGG